MNDKSELQASSDRIASQYAESLVSIWGIFVLILFIHNGSVLVNFFTAYGSSPGMEWVSRRRRPEVLNSYDSLAETL